MSQWVLFKKDDGRIGVLPQQYIDKVTGMKDVLRKNTIEIVSGTFEDACNRCIAIERGD